MLACHNNSRQATSWVTFGQQNIIQQLVFHTEEKVKEIKANNLQVTFVYFLFSIHAVKNTFKDVTSDLLTRSKEEMAMTMVAAEFARSASSQEWVHFFDVLLGKSR